jgi:hypothetical protein
MSRASENAETCRKLAHATTHQEHKKTWLQLAAHWDRLAHEAERARSATARKGQTRSVDLLRGQLRP